VVGALPKGRTRLCAKAKLRIDKEIDYLLGCGKVLNAVDS
jgi:hypothetical protein